MSTLSMETLCFSMKQKEKTAKKKKKKIENDLLTFPKWIICTGVLMARPLDFSTPLT